MGCEQQLHLTARHTNRNASRFRQLLLLLEQGRRLFESIRSRVQRTLSLLQNTQSCAMDRREFRQGCIAVSIYAAENVPRVRDSPSKGIALLVHGWPDRADELFRYQIQALLNAGFSCATVTLPAFDARVQDVASPNFSDVVDDMHELVTSNLLSSAHPVITLIGHDFGCLVVGLYAARYPATVRNLVMLDVGLGRFPKQASFFLTCFLYSYQVAALLCYRVLPRFIAAPIVRAIARVSHAPRNPNEVTPSMGWVYYELYRNYKSLGKELSAIGPNLPILFMYGERNLLRFFSQRWLDRVSKQVHGLCQGFPGDHWFLVRSKCRDQVSEAIVVWLERQRSSSL
ncbi:hypothetical protein FVE85_6657 [Porphyridium purpureum]|uniref:AB hydrolase-1 domain-containing protein n=1 Tax=Porphyridium purpureum TaxID=35688 RepID=A0A5J4Z7Q3_PORPP|nr:hypothetical protein FVE85_6657 [Porphyridium purpureum]|eukprot:POR7862..scf295_1